jgi:hypothetical protein
VADETFHLAYFQNWKGSETLLFSCNDVSSLLLLESVIARLRAAKDNAVEFHTLPFVRSHDSVAVVGSLVAVDSGAFRDGANRFFRWERSTEGWANVTTQIRSLAVHGYASHHYHDGPVDKITVELSLGEYSDEWWQVQA